MKHGLILLLAVGLGAGCGKRSLSATSPPGGSSPDGATGGDGDGGALPDGGIASDGGGADAGPVSCPATLPSLAPTPLRHLTRFEYNNTVRDLLGDTSAPASMLPPDEGAELLVDQMDVSAPLVDGYHAMAHAFALNATKDAASVNALTGCNPAVVGEEPCKQTFIASFIPRLFRRGVDPADAADFGDAFTQGRQLGGDFASGIRAIVEVALQSPEFLYRLDRGDAAGDPAHPGVGRPAPYEMAARLSYLLWGSAPDATLRAEAAAGRLATRSEIAAQARRMLADPRARAVVRYFTFQLLDAHGLDDALSDRQLDANAGFTPQIAALMLEETGRFVDDVTWDTGGGFRALLTAPATFLNGPLARFYGVPGVDGDAFVKVTLDPGRRAGLLTQGSALAARSRQVHASPTRRGQMVFERFLCGQIPPPTAEVHAQIPPPTPPTTRERYQQNLTEASCAGCHQNMEPIGFAFLHYDAVGRWQDIEGGQPIDATGQIFATDARGSFDGAVQLAQRLSESQDAQRCFAARWLTFATGRVPAAADACSLASLNDTFARTGGDVRELLVAITQTDAFLYRLSN